MAKKIHIQTHINDADVEFLAEPRQSLLEALRDIVGLTGTKEGCNDGNCGACSVTIDGRLIDSCLVLAVEAEGKDIQTIEGCGVGRRAPSAAAGILGAGGASVRHLHTRVHRRSQVLAGA